LKPSLLPAPLKCADCNVGDTRQIAARYVDSLVKLLKRRYRQPLLQNSDGVLSVPRPDSNRLAIDEPVGRHLDSDIRAFNALEPVAGPQEHGADVLEIDRGFLPQLVLGSGSLHFITSNGFVCKQF